MSVLFARSAQVSTSSRVFLFYDTISCNGIVLGTITVSQATQTADASSDNPTLQGIARQMNGMPIVYY